MKLTWPGLTLLAILAGCAPAPFLMAPPLPAEILPKPPVSETPVVWQPGDWALAGDSYRYDPGQYVPAAGHSLQWMFGHWEPGAAAPIWVPGHWL